MADLDNVTKRKLEAIFDMSGGYVLGLSNARFGDFIKTAAGFDPYEWYRRRRRPCCFARCGTRSRCRGGRGLLDLLEHWRVGKLVNDQEPTGAELALRDELKAQFTPLATTTDSASLDVLAKDFGDVDLGALPKELSTRQVVLARIDEIDRCLKAEAPMAVIFLVGSTLEASSPSWQWRTHTRMWRGQKRHDFGVEK